MDPNPILLDLAVLEVLNPLHEDKVDPWLTQHVTK